MLLNPRSENVRPAPVPMLIDLVREVFRRCTRSDAALRLKAESARMSGDWNLAASAYREYLKIHPHDPASHNDLGIVFCELGQFDSAQSEFFSAVSQDPGLISAHMNLGNLALQQKRAYREAITHYLAALAINPGQEDARRQISLAHYELGEVEQALSRLDSMHARHDPVGTEYSLFMKNAIPHHDPHAHFEAHLQWARHFEKPELQPGMACPDVASRAEGRIRIGYVSADFREHAVVRFVLPVLERHNRQDFDIFCYANNSEVDHVTARIRQMPVTWRNISTLDDVQVAQLVKQDRIDILIDLSGHTRGNRLGVFALQPAPIQATWLGYLNTTGMSAMGYRFTDSMMDPPHVADAFHAEKLIRLNPSSWCYRPPDDAPDIGKAPCEANLHVTFGSFNHVAKLNLEVLNCWAQVLAACPGSRLKICGIPDMQAAQRIVQPFHELGIGSERIQILPRLPRLELLSEMSNTDIALDPFPYCGGATTCESLWMGLPVVALAGDFGFSRSSSAILTQAGFPDCIANSREDYIDKAVAMAESGVGALRNSMRERLQSSVLMNETGFVNRLEFACRRLIEDAR